MKGEKTALAIKTFKGYRIFKKRRDCHDCISKSFSDQLKLKQLMSATLTVQWYKNKWMYCIPFATGASQHYQMSTQRASMACNKLHNIAL